jgi:two-component system, LytTR family, sensor kinase
MIKKISTYWLYQIIGWGTFIAVNLFFAHLYSKFDSIFVYRLFIYVGLGVATTHLMRFFIKKIKFLAQVLQQQLISFVLVTIIFSLWLSMLESTLIASLQLFSNEEKKISYKTLMLTSVFNSFLILFIWNCIYYIYHYIQKSRRQQLDTLQLETLVKELELKNIKAHINPHFIFNALNSIRALIDENPQRARTAITELSNIFRNSMQSEKMETVPFEKELNIVKDYLALEHIRFEERLQILYEIEESTLHQPVPPMMLQTLVENAIKHGISQRLHGGMVKIISTLHQQSHQLKVQNTGQLIEALPEGGFGLASTQNRLLLLFGTKATFHIKQINSNTVEAFVTLPIVA